MYNFVHKYQEVLSFIECNDCLYIWDGSQAVSLRRKLGKPVKRWLDSDLHKQRKVYHRLFFTSSTLQNLKHVPIIVVGAWHYEVVMAVHFVVILP
ncbi:hypothetical protein L3V43_15630 [Pseudoalteromonas sp. L23]|uniref:hypothetical protein n=1 Tax=unclassified Pseudoalteromonas TaxID=194690 RepID=UPI001EF0051C|nr:MULTISPECIES: hypothetical protein [unclassified Pseudoalteromonas]MCF7515002.1 hypothetical protein [Pseudoalteromonas sp. L7]MCF7527074.1 hypothetical protein [Pseudoalteromonas sp. L23]MCX2767482.1 hypothetical protein [Pseudoalteromonas sp. B530]